MSQVQIACRGVTKSFGSVPVLLDLDVDVPVGAVVTLLGESGSGKTTLLRLIAGFERPDRGTITIGDEIVDSDQRYVPPEKRRIGYVAQEGNLFPHLTVAKNVTFGLAQSDRGEDRVGELLEVVGMKDFGQRYPHQLSGGQQQRVALARALAPHPQVVLLDEPFSSLDASLRSSLRFDVMQILRQRKATTVFVTHDQQEALSVADLVGIVDHGRIRQFDKPEVLYNRPADPRIARFLGEANIVAGTASSGVIKTAFGTRALTKEQASLEGAVVVLIRPEQISLRPLTGAQHDPGQSTGRVVHREYYGHDCVVLVETAEGGPSIRVRCIGQSLVAVGDLVALAATGDYLAWSDRPVQLDEQGLHS